MGNPAISSNYWKRGAGDTSEKKQNGYHVFITWEH